MSLFGWMKRPGVRVESSYPGGPSRTLIRELLWHMEEREQLAREEEQEAHRLSPGSQGCQWTQSYPSLRALIPPSERQQLEHLCARITPEHTAAVLCRFREVLASNDILPWELVYVFKQVLKEFIHKQADEDNGERRLLHPTDAWTNRYHPRQGFVAPAVNDYGRCHKEEIPTISSYVDHSMRRTCPYLAHREWNLPYSYSTRYNCSYSTTL